MIYETLTVTTKKKLIIDTQKDSKKGIKGWHYKKPSLHRDDCKTGENEQRNWKIKR